MNTNPWWHVGSSTGSVDRSRWSIDLSLSDMRGNIARARMRGEFRLVGHRDYQAAIRQIHSACDGPDRSTRTIVRIARVQNRIKVSTLTGIMVGFFSQRDTASYLDVITTIAQRFDEIRCAATVEMDRNGELFIALDVGSPTECATLEGSAAQVPSPTV